MHNGETNVKVMILEDRKPRELRFRYIGRHGGNVNETNIKNSINRFRATISSSERKNKKKRITCESEHFFTSKKTSINEAKRAV